MFGVRHSSKFQQYYRCHPITTLAGPDRSAANFGGKIIVPQSALQKLTMLHISYPMLFEIVNGESGARTHAGVLEFTAEEGRAYLPDWMLQTLGLAPGSLIKITNVSLALGSFVRIQPQSVDFLDISDPKAVLENALRNFSTLTVGDVFQISYNDHTYGIKVEEVKPETDAEGVSIVETDLEVDFSPPVGYVEPSAATSSTTTRHTTPLAPGPMCQAIGYAALARPARRDGNRVSGKSTEAADETVDTTIYSDYNAPPLELPAGKLFFGFPVLPLEEDEAKTERFTGAGNKLRASKKRKEIVV